jgi:signal transduction histidine kinase
MDTQQAKIFVALVMAAAIILVIVFYFVITILRSQRIHMQMQQKSMLLEISGLENDRKRIVSDLHDELGALLSVVKFQVSSVNTPHQQDVDLIRRATANLDSILQRIRSICHEMMPQVLIRKGLQMAIKEFVHEADASYDIQFECAVDESIEISEQKATHMYRIVQESVNNALKHSRASLIRIELSKTNNRIILTISDNGVGFDTRSIYMDNKTSGLKNIMSRIKILNADLYLTSSPGKGTTYNIEAPVN